MSQPAIVVDHLSKRYQLGTAGGLFRYRTLREAMVEPPLKRHSRRVDRRLAFPVAAHLEAESLVVDEVLAVGDAEFQKKCLGKMGGAATEGRTVILVSHNMAAIEQLCRRTILVRAG